MMRLALMEQSVPEIAKAVGRSRATVREWLSFKGMLPRRPGIYLPDEDDELRRLFALGHSAAEISAAIGTRTPASVHNRCHALGLKRPGREGHSASTLRVRLRKVTYSALRQEAKNLGFGNTHRLARALLEIVITDGMVSAVLDMKRSQLARQRVNLISMPPKEAVA